MVTMHSLTRLLQLPPALLLAAFLSSPFAAAASAPIDVELQATFPSPPFLVELLESAATENQSAYHPLVASIASGRFHAPDLTDLQLYDTFAKTLKNEGHITDSAALASWRFSLASRESAPQIEAHHQFWRTTAASTATDSPVEVWRNGKNCASEDCEQLSSTSARDGSHHSLDELHFDRVHNADPLHIPYTIYADLTSNHFPQTFTAWLAKHKNDPYRIRYKPSAKAEAKPLQVGGYGVELALKRTDYIVIDDRDAAQGDSNDANKAATEQLRLEDDTAADLKPLSTTELRRLSVNAASFIIENQDPFDALVKVSQDFPKYAALLSQQNSSKTFLAEHRANRKAFLRPGMNSIWMNGQQIAPRDIDVYSLLESTRRERKLVNSIQAQGLSAKNAIDLLQHRAIADSQSGAAGQRYDYTDRPERGRTMIWLNDIERDTRYSDWPNVNQAYLQRMYPGQLPAVRKNAFHAVIPLDLMDSKGVFDTLETIQTFITRLIPIRFGIVPIAREAGQVPQVRTIYYLKEAYGLSTMLEYIREVAEQGTLETPNQALFDSLVADKKPRKSHKAYPFHTVVADESIIRNGWEGAGKYAKRLALDGGKPPLIINGVPTPKTEMWIQEVSQQITIDLQTIQQQIFQGGLGEDDKIADLFLQGASTHRDPLLIPEDPKDIALHDMTRLYTAYEQVIAASKPFRISNTVKAAKRNSMIIFTDLNSDYGAQLVIDATIFASTHEDVEARFVHHSSTTESITPEGIKRIQDLLAEDRAQPTSDYKETVGKYLTGSLASQSVTDLPQVTEQAAMAAFLGIGPDESGVLFNGRAVSPIPKARTLTADDFNTLYDYETKSRLETTVTALEDLELDQKAKGVFAIAKLASTVALSAISDIPEGIFESAGGARINTFNVWNSSATCIKSGDAETSPIQLTVILDPATEIAQKWVPILRTLSQLDGVHLKLFLNPSDNLEELPVKRFYRQVLQRQPEFATDGSLIGPTAHFGGVPENALLTMGLDTPPSWLVSPKESIHDLDNIKLSSLKGSMHLYALYELEHILIEGHSRDTTLSNPPRGAQLNLATGNDPEFSGTIIMANLGYFQFKANPGVYKLELKDGASQSIFSLDSAGTKGYMPQAGDEKTEIALHSFKGATIFPRLSRKPGQEKADVLDDQTSALEGLATQGANLVDNVMAKAGLPDVKASDYIAKGFKLGQDILGMAGMQKAPASRHADINIFSVASGHLYERMLNIMTVSVMRHTNQTVKFWFIEQFLSPSFKTFLPTMAEEYGFQYEMVTFKWPHWLRAQTEKQRIIWGYKILFLDVLFPLDLDKVIFVDADQIVRTDMAELVAHDLEGAPYGFTPMCDSRTEMEGFRFWKQGYWKNFLRGRAYHISALYVVDLKRFRAIAAGDRLRQQYHALSADPGSLSNLDQDLPNHMQAQLPIHSLPQHWLWCETWCSDAALADARTIDLCNNPQTKEPKLDRARRQVPEWTVYDDEIAALAKRARGRGDAAVDGVIGGPEGVGGAPPVKSGQVVQNKEEL